MKKCLFLYNSMSPFSRKKVYGGESETSDAKVIDGNNRRIVPVNISKLERNKRRKAGKGNYLYTRYADDFVILCNGTKAEARQMKEEIGGLLRNMRLTLSEEKTKITHITEGFTFLGYEILKRTGMH